MRRALADLRFEVEYWLSDTFPMLSHPWEAPVVIGIGALLIAAYVTAYFVFAWAVLR